MSPLEVVLTHVYSWPEVRRGGERYLHELGAALAGAGHSVTILTTSAAGPGREADGEVSVVRLRRRRFRPGRFGVLSEEAGFGLQAARRLLFRNFDVWHALGTADAAAASLIGRLKGARSVYTELGIPDRAYRQWRPDRRLHRYVVDHVDSYVCLSRHAGEVLQRDFGRPAELVPAGVDLAGFQPCAPRHPRPVLLYSGALDEPRKRIPLLLDAAAILVEERPDLELWLSGPGDPDAFLRALNPALASSVRNLGPGDLGDQARRYSSAWVTVLPSENEAFGLSLLESLACGTPVVACEDGGGTADLIHPGIGAMADPSPDSLAAACRYALSLAELGDTVAACRAQASGFDWSASIVPKLERLYAGRP